MAEEHEPTTESLLINIYTKAILFSHVFLSYHSHSSLSDSQLAEMASWWEPATDGWKTDHFLSCAGPHNTLRKIILWNSKNIIESKKYFITKSGKSQQQLQRSYKSP